MLGRRHAARALATCAGSPLRVEWSNGVKTLVFDDPKRLNAWTMKLLASLRSELVSAAADDNVGAVILTATDPYYCAGVDLGALISQPMWPLTLHKHLVQQNIALFEMFLDFPKPLLAAVNGPAIGASVTSATLCEGIIASEKATFSTPFSALGIVPEGCSSVHFARLMGEANATRMLGPEGWRPSAKEAVEAGLIHKVVPHDDLRAAAQGMAEQWISDKRDKNLVSQGLLDEYKRVNREESLALATAFLSPRFFEAQATMANKKGKQSRAAFFTALKITRPLWGVGLPQ